MSNKNDRWSALSMSERAEVFKMGIKKGIKNRKTIIDVYNSFGDGGDTDNTVYYDDTYIEPAVVKAFNSDKEYNRYQGEKFGKQIVKSRDKLGNKLGTLAYDVAQFHPILGTALDIADIVWAKKREDTLPEIMSTDGKILPLIDKIGKTSKVGMGTVFGKILQFPDMAFDALKLIEDLNKPISEYSKGGKLNKFATGGPTREMTPSEAAALNRTLYDSQYMLAVGDSPDDPAFLSTDPLETAVVTASKKESDYKRAEKEASTFRDRSLVGHIGAGMDQNLGDKSLQNIAALSIGVPLIATNPATAPILENTMKGIVHTGKVLLDPTKAITGVGQAAATTADIYGTIEGLRQVPNATKNIIQGNSTAMDYFNLATGLVGPFGTFNTMKGIKNINSFKSPLFDYTTHNINVQQANSNYRANKINVPQSVTESFDNSSYAYNYLLNADNYLTTHDINKLRYLVSKFISKYNPTIQKDILEDPKLLDRLAASYRAFGDSKDAQHHIDLIIGQKFGVNGDFPKSIEDVYFNDPKRYQAITKIIKPLEEKVDKINASRISKLRPSLQQMVEAAPNYLDEIEEYANLGLDDETIAKKILEQRFTFYRGMATDNDINPQNLIQIPIKSSAGRADRQVFGELAENEDVGYLSNSLETAIAYAYPELSQSPNKIVGLIKRRPESFNFEGNPVDWIKNNTLEEANIKRAISTHNIEDDVLESFANNLKKYGVTNLNFDKFKTKRFLQELYDRVNNPKLNNNYFSHFLIKGNKGEYYKNLYIDELNKVPYIYGLSDISELEKIFNTKLNKKAITRFHYGVSTPKASKNKNGGFLTKK